ncbi:MAG TPA: hypothetical protein VJK26_00655 [Patescibacteria group bacterium]|nr:hypothetical protein [Patescibacteria group bacterium]
MPLNFEKKSFELFEKLSSEEKYKVLLAEKDPVKAQTLRSLLTEEEDKRLWEMFNAYKKIAHNLGEILTVSMLGRSFMQEIMSQHLRLVENPCKTSDRDLLEIVEGINSEGKELFKLSKEMIELIEETETLQQQAKLFLELLDRPYILPPELKILANEKIMRVFRKFAKIKNPRDFIRQARTLEAREIIEGLETREKFTEEIKKFQRTI